MCTFALQKRCWWRCDMRRIMLNSNGVNKGHTFAHMLAVDMVYGFWLHLSILCLRTQNFVVINTWRAISVNESRRLVLFVSLFYGRRIHFILQYCGWLSENHLEIKWKWSAHTHNTNAHESKKYALFAECLCMWLVFSMKRIVNYSHVYTLVCIKLLGLALAHLNSN